ncbi:MAG: hypothetical protein H7268_15205 [Sandarakinorhabdus sp.]|nr:hypothetical protein [Sandarakinorhabdus sp.]
MTANWTPTERAAFDAKRRSRNLALGLVLGALVVLFFGITVVRMAPGPDNGKPPVGASASGSVAPETPK